MKRACLGVLALLIGGTCFTDSQAQQSTDMPAAVQPGRGVLLGRQEVLFQRLEDDDPSGYGRIDRTSLTTTLAWGLTRDLALVGSLPVEYRSIEHGDRHPSAERAGVGDLPLLLQWRFHQVDRDAISTQRAALLVGVEIPSWDDGFSSKSLDPLLGVAWTTIHGRHGLNASALWQFNTTSRDNPRAMFFGESRDDALKLDSSYLYRLAPDRYTAQTTGSHYLQLQALGRYETNGDTEILLAPGYMYEGRNWALEATVHLPLWQAVDHRAELAWGLNLGIRRMF